ncbi:DUF2749 domain-containing protein [Bradyrhizobium sp. 156]|uniref:DUF2749 domain-containing protein n=1 Tax=Bradyrhizobium sp. 156 TaxID=2782630 RepID=UPI001FFA1F7B|nr:DUF2749 domain-containing protein [Bradyrhizobium sp. 156]
MRPSTIIIVIVIGAGAAGTWLFLAQRTSVLGRTESRAGDFFTPTQDYKTSGGQPMKPRW